MTLRHLKIFVAVCEYGGITHAAEHLFLAQPAVSVAISELEKYLTEFLENFILQKLENNFWNTPAILSPYFRKWKLKLNTQILQAR